MFSARRRKFTGVFLQCKLADRDRWAKNMPAGPGSVLRKRAGLYIRSCGGKPQNHGSAAGSETIRVAAAMGTTCDDSRAHVLIARYMAASPGSHLYVEMMPFGKYLHTQQIKSFSSGAEVVRSFGSVLQRFFRRKIAFKDESLIFIGNADPKIFHLQFGTIGAYSNRYVDAPAVRRVFNGVSNQPIDNFI
jgi:hypothetical protein